MADQDNGGAALVGALLVCVIAGMALGPGRFAGTSQQHERVQAASLPTSSKVVIENATAFGGTLRVRTTACQDAPNRRDQARLTVTDRHDTTVAQATSSVVGSAAVVANVGTNLEAGRYTVTVQCLSDGAPVGDTFATTVDALPADGGRLTLMPVTGN